MKKGLLVGRPLVCFDFWFWVYFLLAVFLERASRVRDARAKVAGSGTALLPGAGAGSGSGSGVVYPPDLMISWMSLPSPPS